jgi:phenylalanyl-tRNA synthetase beta chain
VARDISFFCDRAQSSDHLREVVRKAAGPNLRSVDVVDLYKGKPVPEGRVSLTLSLRFQDAERTLTGDEVQRSVADVMKALEDDLKAEIRGE